MQNFWAKLPKPFFVLAPMEDVTDAAFRALIATHSSPEIPRVLYTEFTSADGLVRAGEEGQQRLLKKLEYTAIEKPIVAQLFSAHPVYMEGAAQVVASLGFDGIDINMGCPDKAVEKQGSGAALIKNPTLACELIQAARRGAPHLPLSIKTRIGYNVEEIDTWIPQILAEHPEALIVHLRTRKELSEVPAHWELMPRIVALRDALSPETVIIGNGDVRDIADARAKAAESGCDGVMIGRGVFGNPWLFGVRTDTPSIDERINALAQHIALFQEKLLGTVSEAVMKRHFKAYINGWPNAADLRMRLMETTDLAEAIKLLKQPLED